jgi:hypothetical protein
MTGTFFGVDAMKRAAHIKLLVSEETVVSYKQLCH